MEAKWTEWAAEVARAVREVDGAKYRGRWEYGGGREADGKHVAEVLPVSASMWSRIKTGQSKPGAALVVTAHALFGVDPRPYVIEGEGFHVADAARYH